MPATYVTYFSSFQPGAPAVSSTVGTLINVLSHCLIIGAVYRTADDSAFTDNTTEARLDAGTAFTLFPTPGTSDRTYFGHSTPFTRLKFDVATASTTNTYVWEYWNGTTWTTLTVTDGTSAFTVDGSVTWTAPASWTYNTINSTSMYWVRVRISGSAGGVNPTINSVSYLGWLEAFTGTNQRDYRASAGNQLYIEVNDNGPGTGGAREARVVGYETMTALSTGTNLFPTAVQLANAVAWRKSTTAPVSAAARNWVVVADDRTFYLWIATTDFSYYYSFGMFGDFYSVKTTTDSYRTMIIGRTPEAAALANSTGDFGSSFSALNTLLSGHYIARTYDGSGTSIQAGKHGDGVKGSTTIMIGSVPYLNLPNKSIIASPIWVHQGSSVVRGRMRGLWHVLHPLGSIADFDTFTYAGKTFRAIKGSCASAASTITDIYLVETSDTWDTN